MSCLQDWCSLYGAASEKEMKSVSMLWTLMQNIRGNLSSFKPDDIVKPLCSLQNRDDSAELVLQLAVEAVEQCIFHVQVFCAIVGFLV